MERGVLKRPPRREDGMICKCGHEPKCHGGDGSGDCFGGMFPGCACNKFAVDTSAAVSREIAKQIKEAKGSKP